MNIRLTNSNKIEIIKEDFFDKIYKNIGENEIPELKGDCDKEEKDNNNTEIDYNKDKVFEFIGGGALLITNKNVISGEELYKNQLFNDLFSNKDLSGFNSKQLQNEVWRIMVAKLNEIPFFIFTDNKPVKLQKTFSDLGFSDLVCFDGGNKVFVANKEKIIKGKGKNSPSGFAVKVDKKYE